MLKFSYFLGINTYTVPSTCAGDLRELLRVPLRSRDTVDLGGASRASTIFGVMEAMDCGPPGSSLHGISQARILEWVRGVREKETTGVSVKLVAFGSSSRYI